MGRNQRKGGGTKPLKPPKKQIPKVAANTSNKSSPSSNSNGSTATGIRTILLATCLGYFALKGLQPRLLPHGGAVQLKERPSFKPVDPTNDSLLGKHGKLTKIYQRQADGEEQLLKGPETVVVNPKDGTIYVLTEEAKLVSLTDFESHSKQQDDGEANIVTAKATTVIDLGMGRPLGGRFTADGKTIYIADALLGLIRVQNPGHPKQQSKVELVAHQVMDNDNNNTMTRIRYANDVAIGPKTGKVYFTDASDISPDRIETRTWDTMYAAKTDLMRGKRTGRLLEYDPKTNQVKVLAKDFWFANGIGVDKDESFVFLAETFALRLVKYHLKGSQKGTVETLVDSKDMTGYPDGADCTPAGSKHQKCYAVMPSAVIPLGKLINKVPSPFDRILRNIVMMLPKKMAPKIQPYGGAVEVDPKTKEIRHFQDPHATDIGHLAGVTVWNNKLYLGSLRNNFIGMYDLN